jgi:hypothetical protein
MIAAVSRTLKTSSERVRSLTEELEVVLCLQSAKPDFEECYNARTRRRSFAAGTSKLYLLWHRTYDSFEYDSAP